MLRHEKGMARSAGRWLALLHPLLAAAPAQAADALVARPILLNDNGAWSWFEDERAIIDPVGGKLLVSSVADESGPGGATRGGDIDVVSYDLATGQTDLFVLNAGLEDDDHNSASLYIRPDGRYVAMYAKHGSDPFSRYRISTNPHDATSWNAEQVFNNGAGTTYSNLHHLPADDSGAGRLYNFTRTNNYDPNILVSSDHGDSWSYGGKLFNEGGGGDRPYVRYFSDGDKIHLITTERHPRNYDNSVYHGYIQDGRLYNTSGTLLDGDLFNGSAVRPNQLTPLLTTGTVVGGESMRHGWTVDVAIDPAGQPVAVHQARADNDSTNHRFFYSRWDGAQWRVNSLGYAGSYLYGAENDYTGLVAIDPDDVNTVYLSSEVHPATKAQLIGADGERHYELFRGVTADGGESWDWTPLTYNSTQDNLRPIVPKWDTENTAVLWMRGEYSTYTNYDLDVVGFINAPEAAIVPALSVDFGDSGQAVQAGFEPFAPGAASRSFASPFASGSGGLTVGLDAGAQFRDRGDGVDSPVGDVVEDFVFNADDLTLTLEGLQAGYYQLVLYGHDSDFSQVGYEVLINGAKQGELTPTEGADPLIGVASARYGFHADGVSGVEVALASLGGGAVVLNGFELYATDAPYLPPPVDLNGDGLLDFADYKILTENLHSDLSALGSLEAYARGDLNGDLRADFADFALFRAEYIAWNGESAFESLIVPEPSTVAMVSGLALIQLATRTVRGLIDNAASAAQPETP